MLVKSSRSLSRQAIKVEFEGRTHQRVRAIGKFGVRSPFHVCLAEQPVPELPGSCDRALPAGTSRGAGIDDDADGALAETPVA